MNFSGRSLTVASAALDDQLFIEDGTRISNRSYVGYRGGPVHE